MSLSILLLSEDGADEAHDTVKALARRMLLLLDPACQTHRVRFEPLTNEQARSAVRATLWKSRASQDRNARIELLRTMATKLLEGERSFVFFHIDGDRPWTDRRSSENLAKFAGFKTELGRLVTMFLQQQGVPAPAVSPLERLLLLAPFWCIETWVYQNTVEAVRICRERYRGRDADLFLAWKEDRAALDEVRSPGDTICLGSCHNKELAERGYPADAVYQAGASFAATVDRLLECDLLCAAVAGTHHS